MGSEKLLDSALYDISVLYQILLKGLIPIVLITKDEANAIRAKYPNVHIRRTSQQRSDRHRYYMSEVPSAMRYLKRIREGGAV